MRRPPKRIGKSLRQDQIERLTAHNDVATLANHIELFPRLCPPSGLEARVMRFAEQDLSTYGHVLDVMFK